MWKQNFDYKKKVKSHLKEGKQVVAVKWKVVALEKGWRSQQM